MGDKWGKGKKAFFEVKSSDSEIRLIPLGKGIPDSLDDFLSTECTYSERSFFDSKIFVFKNMGFLDQTTLLEKIQGAGFQLEKGDFSPKVEEPNEDDEPEIEEEEYPSLDDEYFESDEQPPSTSED